MMDDRVHPRVVDSPPASDEPPPKKSSACRGRFCCAAISLIVLIPILVVAAGGVFYLVCRPSFPSFSVQRVSVIGINFASSTKTVVISPAINVTVKVENRNTKIGVYYEQGSFVSVYYGNMKLCQGELPVFYQTPRNVTVFVTQLDGRDVVVSSDVREKLVEEQKKGRVGLTIDVRLPVRVRVGKATTWKLTAKGDCAVVLNGFTVKAKVVSRKCKVQVHPW